MKLRKSFWLTIFLMFLIASCPGCGKKETSEALPNIKVKQTLSTMQAVSVFGLARKALALYPDMEKALNIPLEKDLPQICDREIFVTIFHEGCPQITGVGTYGCTQERILRAVVNLTNNPKFKKYYLLTLESAALKVDILTYRKHLDMDKSLRKINVEPGMHGLLLQDGERMFYQLPSDYIHFGWEPDDKGKHLKQRRLKMQLRHLGKQAGLGGGAYKNYPIYRIKTRSYLQHRPDLVAVPLYRANLLQKNYIASDMARGAAEAGNWLINNIEPTGRFRYNYNPTTGKLSSFLDYDAARHAGTVYSLMRLYNQSLEPKYLERGAAAMEFLKRHLKAPLLEPNLLAIRNPIAGGYKLSTAAMTLIALCEFPDEQFAKIGQETTNKLARFLLKMQLDNGDFYSRYYKKLAGFKPNKKDVATQGDALLALVRYYNKNTNVDWLEAARKAAENQIALFRETNKPDFWTVVALAELYEADPNTNYATAAFEMADEIMEHQYIDSKYSDYNGGFDYSRPPRTIHAASRAQALSAVSRICWLLGKDCKKYDDAIILTARFLLWNQYRNENSYFIPMPDSAAGAVKGGLVDQNIRMDYCQQAILALIGAYRVAIQKQKINTESEKPASQKLTIQ